MAHLSQAAKMENGRNGSRISVRSIERHSKHIPYQLVLLHIDTHSSALGCCEAARLVVVTKSNVSASNTAATEKAVGIQKRKEAADQHDDRK